MNEGTMGELSFGFAVEGDAGCSDGMSVAVQRPD